jgi:PAS domain S-box-containing protein
MLGVRGSGSPHAPGLLTRLRTLLRAARSAIRRRRLPEPLRDADVLFRTLVEQVPAVVYVDAIDDVSTALYVSPQHEKLLGYTPEEWIANPTLWVDLLHPEDRDRVLEESLRTNVTGQPFSSEYRLFHRDGHVVWVRDEAMMVRDETGRPIYWQGILVDITERMKTEQAVRRAYDRERQAADRLRSLDEMKNAFLNAVSHELRTPLAALLGFALTLEQRQEALSPEEQRDLLARLARNARKLDTLLSDLLDLDRLRRGVLEPQRRLVDVGALAQRVVEEAQAGPGRIDVDAPPTVAALDGSKVERILENLVANSLKHTLPRTRIWLTVRQEEEGVLIAVEDDGPGVPDDLKQEVFEPFRQGDEVHPHAPGAGIGLSLVALFAELHGGRAWVEDRPGGGASFRVFLPERPAAGEARSASGAEADQEEPGSEDGDGQGPSQDYAASVWRSPSSSERGS